jgi:phosphoribosyl-ATP pyrophosphohydrolase
MTATPTKNSICAHRRRQAARGLQELDAVDARAVSFTAAETSEKSRGLLVEGPHEIELLYAALGRVTEDKHPRTARLLVSSSRKVAQKVIEEAGEVALAAVKHNGRNIVRESADLLYQLAILWHHEGIPPREIWSEMRRRADTLGIAEKLPKPSKPGLSYSAHRKTRHKPLAL